jgi:hypothetical protein
MVTPLGRVGLAQPFHHKGGRVAGFCKLKAKPLKLAVITVDLAFVGLLHVVKVSASTPGIDIKLLATGLEKLN